MKATCCHCAPERRLRHYQAVGEAASGSLYYHQIRTGCQLMAIGHGDIRLPEANRMLAEETALQVSYPPCSPTRWTAAGGGPLRWIPRPEIRPG